MEKQENRDENHYSDLQNTILYILLKNGGYMSADNLIESTRISLFELFHTLPCMVRESKIQVQIKLSSVIMPEGTSRTDAIYYRFRQLVYVYHKGYHTIDFYASRLCISPKYLSSIVKRIGGRTPREWINYELMMSIKQELRSSKSLKEIAFEFNFSSISSFGKYFKSRTGISPSQYRRNEINRQLYE